MSDKVSAKVIPDHALSVLSQKEVERVISLRNYDKQDIFRQCALAVLNTGSDSDDTSEILEQYADFVIDIVQQERGVKLQVENAPSGAFVDGDMILGIQEHLFSVLRDILYMSQEVQDLQDIDFSNSEGITNGVFHILRNSGLLKPTTQTNIVVCWGGHSIGPAEYDYSKEVGYEMGLRGLDICTGCGPGAMKGPMKGATFGHAKQRSHGRYIGISEPGIIAAESPNPIVNKLIIMPDIEKRLEAFVRTGHGIIVFPGGVGTAEEILYLLGILLSPNNEDVPFPLVFTGPESSRAYFEKIDAFIGLALGEKAQERYKIIIDDAEAVAKTMVAGCQEVYDHRRRTQDAFYFNWVLDIPHEFQIPFLPNHARMRELNLTKDQPIGELACNLRKAFSGMVDGNVKENGIKAVAKHGPYEISGDKAIIEPLGELLAEFVAQNRMKIPTKEYIPCYKIVD